MTGQGAIAARAVDVWKAYGTSPTTRVNALCGVTAEFSSREFTSIMGPSGSGKSTLMHCLAGMEAVTRGDIWLGEQRLSILTDRALTNLRRHVGFIFQQFNLLPSLTVNENILLPMAIAGQRPDLAWKERILSTLGIAEHLDRLPVDLSGGQQQKVACARALLAKPSVIFADEPTGNLDSRSGIELLELLRVAATDLEQTLILVTHDPKVASYSDRTLLLADGHIVDEITSPTADRLLRATALSTR